MFFNIELEALTPRFAIGVKRDPIRQILLAPTNHLTNCELVKEIQTWTVIDNIYKYIQTLCKLSGNSLLEGIAANFGKWETASADDDSDYAMDCHGHIHMYLSRDAVDKLSALDEKCGWRAIHARIKNPDTYLESDCHDLEVCRLIRAEHKLLHDRMDAIQNKLDAVMEETKKDAASTKEDLAKLIRELLTLNNNK